MLKRFHIQFDSRRTTITLDTVLFEMLAIKLGISPDDKNAHTLVRQWLETTIKDRQGNDQRSGAKLSQWVRYFAIREIAAPELESAFVKWLDRKVRI